MNIEEFRDYCLSMDGVMEKTPFGKFAPRFDSTLVFYVLDHMFCMVDMDDFTSVSFRSNDEEIARITERYSAVTPPGKQGDEVLAKTGNILVVFWNELQCHFLHECDIIARQGRLNRPGGILRGF